MPQTYSIAPGLTNGSHTSPIRGSGPWLVLLAAFFGWMFDGVELGLFPLTARPAIQEMLSRTMTPEQVATHIGSWMSYIAAGTLVGAAAGGVLFGWLGDRIGRVSTLAWTVLTYSVFSGICAVATRPLHLFVLRFLSSLGMGGEWAVGVALVMEVWPGRWRPMLASIMGVAANAGFFLIALLGLALGRALTQVGAFLHLIHLPQTWAQALLAHSGWRVLYLMGAVPALLTFFVRIFVPESERWQHAAATAPPGRVSDIFQGGLARLTLLGTTLSGIALLGTWGSVQWIASWAGKLGAARIPPIESDARSTAQIAVTLGAVAGCIVSAPMLRWVKRRTGFFALSLLSLVTCAYLFRAGFTYGPAFLTLVFLTGAFTASFYAWLPLYLPELFPTRVRATAQGFAYNIGRVLAAAGILCSGQLLNHFNEDYAKMCSVISLVYVAGLIVIWFCPETRGKPLPD
jgi:SHS family sialic acid transporter-like MFS transporter